MLNRFRWRLIGSALPLLFAAGQAWAQEATPTTTTTPTPTVVVTPTAQATAVPSVQSAPGVAEVTFAQLGQPSFELRSPAESLTFPWRLPYRWELLAGNDRHFLELHYDLYASSLEGVLLPGAQASIPALDVYLNETLIYSFAPLAGVNQGVRIPLPPALLETAAGQPNQLRLAHADSRECAGLNLTRLVIHDQSFLHLSYRERPLNLTLAEWPQLLAHGSFVPEPLLLVIPDAYSDNDLSAAATVAAAVGRHSMGKVEVQVVTAGAVTATMLADRSAIIVGQPGVNAFLDGLYANKRLSTAVTTRGHIVINGQVVGPEDGVLQLAVPEYSLDHAYLVVSGNSETAVSRAARALSWGSGSNFNGHLAVVTLANEANRPATPQAETLTLGEMGLGDTTVYGLGVRRVAVDFFVPAAWPPPDRAQVTIDYLYSAALQPGTSDVTLALNGRPVASAPIEQGNPEAKTVVADLDAADFILGGMNRLTLVITLDVNQACVAADTRAAWVRIRETSALQMPYRSSQAAAPELSLAHGLTPVITRRDLGDLRFILPAEPTLNEVAAAMRLAWALGFQSGGEGFAPQVVRGSIGEQVDEQVNVIGVGLPAVNPVIAQMNDQLPQPFIPERNILRLEVDSTIPATAVGDELNVGVVEIFATAESNQAIVIMSGTSAEGMARAAETLAGKSGLLSDGDVALVLPESVQLFTSQPEDQDATPAAGEPNSGRTPAPGGTVMPAPTPVAADPSALMLRLALLLVSLGVAVVAAGTIWMKRGGDSDTDLL